MSDPSRDQNRSVVRGLLVVTGVLMLWPIALMLWAYVGHKYWVWFGEPYFDFPVDWRTALGFVLLVRFAGLLATYHLPDDSFEEAGKDWASRMGARAGRNSASALCLPVVLWIKGWIVYSVFF